MKTSLLDTENREQAVNSVAPDFNHLARIYRWMEWLTFGPFLQRCRTTFFSNLQQRRRGLVLGDGDGRFTSRLLRTNAHILVDAVDASESMLSQLATRASSNNRRVHTHFADARTFQPPHHRYDLIATHFFLDCLTTSEVKLLASRLRRHAAPNALWVVSEFAIPSNFYGRAIARPLISALYLAFRLLTRLRIRALPNHHVALAQAGWSLVHQQKRLGGLLISELWQHDLQS
jgi:ubiquinone/menaquinone biosynthesis C-methylase UbiE